MTHNSTSMSLPGLSTITAPNAINVSSSNKPIILVEDLEIARENIVEAKHRRLVRSHKNGPLDRELKPNPKIRDELAVWFLSLLFCIF
jgi:phosphatidylinositol 3-kinase